MTKVITYNAGPTGKLFHRSDAFVRALMGPVGSGKSVACTTETIRKGRKQAPFYEQGTDFLGAPKGLGVRYSRWVIVRNTYRELEDTTMETFFGWIPKSTGHFSSLKSKFTQHAKLEDGTVMHAEYLFRALDRPDDVKKLLSLEVTGGWLNEAREIPKAIMDMTISRLGRYPGPQLGGPTWYGLIMDTNPPDTDHWWYKLFEDQKPDGFALFKQPSGVGPLAENVDNLPKGYYERMQSGKDKEWIKVYVHGSYGFVQDGKPVYPEYKDDIHAVDWEYTPNPKLKIFVGLDFGLTPAAVFAQQTATGRWIFFDELVTEDMGAVNFGALLKQQIKHKYRAWCDEKDKITNIEFWGDPSGDIRAQTDETTPFEILDNAGIVAWPTHTNDFVVRRETAAKIMGKLDFAGNPAFCVTSGAPMFRKALAGGYKYKRLAVSGGDKFQDKPDKGRYSHVAEAGQYLLLGAGEDDGVVGGYGTKEVDYSETNKLVV